MPTAANARLDYEAAQTLLPMAQLIDSGDHQTFTSGADLWSQRAGYTPVIRPNGLLTGGLISPTSNQHDQIDVAALTVQLQGLVLPVAGTVGIPVTRGMGGDTHVINSITVTAAGSIAVLVGEEGTSFTEARGAAGGPPFIPANSVEIGQVRLTDTESGPVTSAEIFQKPGIHQERANFPGFTANPLLGELTFVAPLPLSHVGGLPKAIYAEVYEPEFAEVDLASSFVPPETTHSVSSTQVYGRAVGASSSSLNQGSFKALLEDGVTDPLVLLKNEVLFFRFYPDQNKSAHLLCFGTLGLARQFPADNHIEGSFTVSAALRCGGTGVLSMPFDAKAFSKAAFEPRTAEVRIPELKEWFGGEEPIFRVRGLSGIELAQALEAAQTSQSRAELAEALLDGTDGAKVDAVKEAFGLGKGVPDELIRYHELVIRGSVEPKLTRDVSVKLAERFPIDHKQLALKILALTGQGYAVKKKPSGCSAIPKSAPA